MSDAPDMFRYDVVTRYLHWLTFLLVVLLWMVGQTITSFHVTPASRRHARCISCSASCWPALS